MRKILLIACFILLVGCVSEEVEESSFCGSSTYASCSSDSDCGTGGCSGQICLGVDEEQMVTTCEWLDCYDDEAYDVSCSCVEEQCQWN